MLEMPDLFERHMLIGQKHVENKEFIEASEHFEKAYDIKDDLVANVSLTKSLMELEAYDVAYNIMVEHKKDYLQNKEYHDVYFTLLNKCHLFLEIEKFFLLSHVTVKAEWEKNYEIAKDYQLVINQKKFNELKTLFLSIPEKKPLEQTMILKQMVYFPKEVFVELAKELIVAKQLPIFLRNELVNQLVQLKVEEEINLLTWEEVQREFIPSKGVSLADSYRDSEIVKEVAEYYTMNQPSLKQEVLQLMKLHIGCMYPFEKETMQPVSDWVNSYIHRYLDETSDKALESIYTYQQKLDEEITKLLIFQ